MKELIDIFNKCRLENIFGDGTYWGCLTISKLLIAVGMTGLVLMFLKFIIILNSRNL